MTEFPSQVLSGPNADAATLFPTLLPDPEKLVYDFVKAAAAAAQPSGVPALSFYADRTRPQPEIPVVRGWPAYPGKVPAIGVASGPESEDKQHELPAAGFAGDVVHREGGAIVATATYHAEPLYSTVLVELIHENRDERDRLHNELRRVLFPLRRKLPRLDQLVRKVQVDAEKTESSQGPPVVEQPFTVYLSIFTVHVYYEMLEASNVRGEDLTIGRIDVSVPIEVPDPAQPPVDVVIGEPAPAGTQFVVLD